MGVDANGDIFIVSTASAYLETPKIDVRKISGADGATLWERGFETWTGENRGIAIDPQGDLIVTGIFSGGCVNNVCLDFGGGPLTTSETSQMFLVKLSGHNGGHIWTRASTTPPGQIGWAEGLDVAADANGDIAVIGPFYYQVSVGGGPLTTASQSGLFVARYSGHDGSHLWSRGLSTSEFCFCSVWGGVAFAPQGDVLVAGNLLGATDLGGRVLDPSAGREMFIARFGRTDGAHVWSRQYGDLGFDRVVDIAADPTGNLVITGLFSGTVSFGGGLAPLKGPASQSMFVAKYDGNGEHLWSRSYAGEPIAVGIDASGHVLVTGGFQGRADFGSGVPFTSVGDTDAFVLRLKP